MVFLSRSQEIIQVVFLRKQMFRLLGGSQKSGVGDAVLGSPILMSPEKYFGWALETHPHFQTTSFNEVLHSASQGVFLWCNCHMLYIWNLNSWNVWRYCQYKSCLPIYYTIGRELMPLTFLSSITESDSRQEKGMVPSEFNPGVTYNWDQPYT